MKFHLLPEFYNPLFSSHWLLLLTLLFDVLEVQSVFRKIFEEIGSLDLRRMTCSKIDYLQNALGGSKIINENIALWLKYGVWFIDYSLTSVFCRIGLSQNHNFVVICIGEWFEWFSGPASKFFTIPTGLSFESGKVELKFSKLAQSLTM